MHQPFLRGLAPSIGQKSTAATIDATVARHRYMESQPCRESLQLRGREDHFLVADIAQPRGRQYHFPGCGDQHEGTWRQTCPPGVSLNGDLKSVAKLK